MTASQPRATTIGNRLAPARFVVFLLLLPAGFLAYRAAFGGRHWGDAVAMAFDAAAAVFLASLLPLIWRDYEAPAMREHAARNDANRMLVLLLTTLLGFAVMAAIAGEMPQAREGDHVAAIKLVGTLLLIWLFANSVFTLHYAHAFYARHCDGGDCGGFDFPGTTTPDYRDFAYFAFTLGMTFQTSDVAISAPKLRHAALLHSFGAFVFNIGVIAFAINVLGGG
ncbi:MAG TPA: DUF1345 domain-containing protein [Croceibacterium sp.]|nr:DUF1345 domain-containing protein [Croceibacterium sp.]